MLHLLNKLCIWLIAAVRYLVIGPQPSPPGRSFTDTRGRKWYLHLTPRMVSTVHRETGVMLTGMFLDDLKPIAELSTQYDKQVEVLWALCEKQADTSGVTVEQFAESLGGDALGNAWEALLRATADFFTFPEQRTAMHAMLDMLLETATAYSKETKAMFQGMDRSQLAKSCLDFVTSGQGKPDATQKNTPLANSAC